MTEEKRKRPVRSVKLPTELSLDILVQWATRGPASLTPAAPGAVLNRQRSRMMTHLRRLVATLDVPGDLAATLEGMRYQEFALLDTELLAQLARQARLGGLVTAGCRERVPLTPVQTSTLRRLSWGVTYDGVAAQDGCAGSTVGDSVKRAKRQLGCVSTSELMATAYREGWFPTGTELRTLLSGRMVWDAPVPGPLHLPPYMYREDLG